MLRILAVLTASLACLGAAAAPLQTDHPLVGTWEFKLPNGCVERMTVLQNGHVLAVSGAENDESEAEIADQPDARGFYKWRDRILSNNGRPDCGDTLTPVGDVSVVYVRLEASGDRFHVCLGDAKGDPCLGPYIRQRLAR
jgi:hypothetical protein